MTWANAFFYSVCVLAIAIVVASLSPVIAQSARSGGYMVASGGGSFVWRVNTSTGTLSYCVRPNDIISADGIASQKPYCSGVAAAPQI